MLAENEALHDHLVASGQVRIGSCRDVSVTIPQARIALFAGLAANDVEATDELAKAKVMIWSLSADGSIAVEGQAVPPFRQAQLNSWKVMVAPDVADAIEAARRDGVVETGGILLGGFDLMPVEFETISRQVGDCDCFFRK